MESDTFYIFILEVTVITVNILLLYVLHYEVDPTLKI